LLVGLALIGGLGTGCTPTAGSRDKPAATEPELAKHEAAQPPSESSGAIPAPADLETPPADATKTASGLVTKVLVAGTGEKAPRAYDAVRVHYTGWNARGKLIDSSKKNGSPATFQLAGVIPGWAEGLQLMRVGEKRRLWIPDALSYKGRPGPPRGDDVFDIELLEIIEGEVKAAPNDVAAPPADATKTKSGLSYKVLQSAAGEDKPKAWDRVTLSYTGWTTDGSMFDGASKASFDVGDVMPGWAEALQRMATGASVRLWVPQSLAYQGRAGSPKGTLVFDIELLSIERRPEPPRAPEHVSAPPKSAKRTKSGLAYRVLEQGDGEVKPTATSRVRVHYSGWTTDGALFDSSVVRGTPVSVPLEAVIAGWSEALQLMVGGDRYLLWVPEDLAYEGKPGRPPGMLVYELELLEIVQQAEARTNSGKD
jgi:FKBP-type peptidyl-prolyl cis-trans isomerase